MKMKNCNKCYKSLDESNFFKREYKGKVYIRGACKVCHNTKPPKPKDKVKNVPLSRINELNLI